MELEGQGVDPKFFTGDDQRPIIAKAVVPAIFVLAGILLGGAPTTRPLGLILCGIFILVGVAQFLLIGLVRPTEDCIHYKRFNKWRRIEYSNIVRCNRSLFPLFWGLHYLRLRNSRFPLGTLYFVQYHPAKLGSQYELDREMIAQIRQRIAGKGLPLQDLSAKSSGKLTGSLQLGIKACVITTILSMLVVLFLRVLLSWPGPNFPPKVVAGQGVVYRIVVYLSLFCMHLLTWPYNLAVSLGLVVGIALLRFRGHAVFLSLALGAILGGIVARWLGAS